MFCRFGGEDTHKIHKDVGEIDSSHKQVVFVQLRQKMQKEGKIKQSRNGCDLVNCFAWSVRDDHH